MLSNKAWNLLTAKDTHSHILSRAAQNPLRTADDNQPANITYYIDWLLINIIIIVWIIITNIAGALVGRCAYRPAAATAFELGVLTKVAVGRISEKHTCLITLLVAVPIRDSSVTLKRPLTSPPEIITITSSLMLHLYPHPKLHPPLYLTSLGENEVSTKISSNCPRNNEGAITEFQRTQHFSFCTRWFSIAIYNFDVLRY